MSLVVVTYYDTVTLTVPKRLINLTRDIVTVLQRDQTYKGMEIKTRSPLNHQAKILLGAFSVSVQYHNLNGMDALFADDLIYYLTDELGMKPFSTMPIAPGSGYSVGTKWFFTTE